MPKSNAASCPDQPAQGQTKPAKSTRQISSDMNRQLPIMMTLKRFEPFPIILRSPDPLRRIESPITGFYGLRADREKAAIRLYFKFRGVGTNAETASLVVEGNKKCGPYERKSS